MDIVGTSDDLLYRTQRHGNSFGYSFPVSNGIYEVFLYFSELQYSARNKRKFDVTIEGLLLHDNFDVFAQVGAKNAPVILFDYVAVTDQQLDILFQGGGTTATLSGIEAGPLSTATLRINAGGKEYQDSSGRTWLNDLGYSGGNSIATSTQVSDTIDDPLYKSSRRGMSFTYRLPLANGRYKVKLLFSETQYANVGKRIFDIDAEGATVINDLDIYAALRKRWGSLQKEVAVDINDGILDLEFRSVKGPALVCGLEIIKQ